ncbi:MAG: 16S rRNA (adenine(1518)-N(6)/adenine(1519)-N(6))-dimethyltransferase RsmA [Alphaproteobacteria bacterium]|nr:16S rRNA (adenine(1518)-N(6)/adenine(1519)-N(6))-dimethyltransferase RsmA [Alphaproteobacteria bacterium]MBU0796677.1 16S rRNA (adenine(1518)-N(6)/adenine(1519)-N(6))-dimethyltransferase RsmA [Alphaproteobacteria bacterium]MBU0888226.1 16S rRNA (adenine(1518)-N(6)/adenine(1519)-N(6))-dimethyltransferase RsmA [Alphaproteobacteria bacterium]MBU1811427.1 16S rRNA (adenine(1518)-N(6)/adenine(1519)-N(6))-dimethyltransferase RsmA [Alphaproteobacteria bacterium]
MDDIQAAIAALPPLREVIASNELAAKKQLGQNFLLDLNLTGRIARSAGDLASGTTIEIGPGPGGLTRALLLAGATRLVAIERDQRCIVALQPLVEAAAGRLTVIEADALEIDITSLGPAPHRIAANLPYNIATALLMRWLDRLDTLDGLTLMFQKEVGDRLRAKPGGDAYGRLSVITQWLCEASAVFDIPPRAFTPAPKVVSTVIRLVPRPKPLAPARKATLERVTAAAFGQRRKMLRQSLKTLGIDPLPLLAATGIDPTGRAEQLTIQQFCALAEAVDAAAA